MDAPVGMIDSKKKPKQENITHLNDIREQNSAHAIKSTPSLYTMSGKAMQEE